jgi:hypothetical protein
MVMNNEFGITCHSLSEDAIVLCKGTEENNKPQQESWSLAYGIDTHRRQEALGIATGVFKYRGPSAKATK